MQTKPEKWDALLQNVNHLYEFKATVAGKEYFSSDIWNASINFPMMETLSIGTAATASLNMTITPKGNIPTGAEIKCYLRLRTNDDPVYITADDDSRIKTDDGYVLAASYPEFSGWLPFGTFYISRRSKEPSGRLTIEARDAMMKAEQDYIDNTGAYPMQMSNALNVICGMLGISLDSRSKIAPYTIDSPTGVYTIREVIEGIAAASGGNAFITKDGKLFIKRIESPVQTAETPTVNCRVYAENAVTIGKVTLYPDSETQYSSGTSGYEIQADCTYASQAICDYVRSVLNGVTYLPYSATTAYFDPALELGDSINVNGNLSVLAAVDYKIGPAMTANAEAAIDAETDTEYPYKVRTREERKNAVSFSEIRKTTEQIRLSVDGKADAEDVQTAIDLNLNNLSLSYTAGENGASITLSKDGVSITGDVKIGSIDASKITVKNIDADEITVGSLYGIDIVGCNIYAQESRKEYAKITATGLEVYTDNTFKMGLAVINDSPTLELGNTTPGIVQKVFEESAHRLWIGDRNWRDGFLIDFTNHTIKKFKNGTGTVI